LVFSAYLAEEQVHQIVLHIKAFLLISDLHIPF